MAIEIDFDEEEGVMPPVTTEERITSPDQVLRMHGIFCEDDKLSSADRAAIQELMDFVVPLDQADLDERGQGERFNVNFGMAASAKNESVGAYMEMYAQPEKLIEIKLKKHFEPEYADQFADVMSKKFTDMIRTWDVMPSNVMLLADTYVTQGVAIPWFADQATLDHEIASLEDCKFPADTLAITSKIEVLTIERKMSPTDLYSKIENADEDEEWIEGWNVKMIKSALINAKPKAWDDNQTWNYEAAARTIKENRVNSSGALNSINVVICVVRELNGKMSLYQALKNPPSDQNIEKPEFIYKKRNAFDRADNMFQIFAFGVGNKNRIYTIRGLGFAIYEAGQADNMIRCKGLDAVAFRAGEVFQSEGPINSIDDIQFIDVGHSIIAPKSLRAQEVRNTTKLDDTIGFGMRMTAEPILKHTTGVAGSSLTENPGARRNEMQVIAELEHMNKLNTFAINLYYSPWSGYLRELVRRAFTETQMSPELAGMVAGMKEACLEEGVPEEAFSMIDFKLTNAYKLQGAGSRASRLISYQQMGQLYSRMSPKGQEQYDYDFAAELQGYDKAVRYFGLPQEPEYHFDISLARIENGILLNGGEIQPVPGENGMVHMREHIPALQEGLQGIDEGTVDLGEWTIQNIQLFTHAASTMEIINVDESLLPEFNQMRQIMQQIGAILENGMRHLNKRRKEQEAQGGQEGEEGDPAAQQEASAAQMDNQIKQAQMISQANAKIQSMQMLSQAKQKIMEQESAAKIAAMDAEVASKIRRQQVVDRAIRR